MKIGIISDVHAEFFPSGTRLYTPPEQGEVRPPLHPYGPDLSILNGKIDLLILAGDVAVGSGTCDLLRAIRSYLDVPVAYVMGNHEPYQGTIEILLRTFREELAGSGVHFLDCDELVLDAADGKRVRILGCTLWTNFALFGDHNVEPCMIAAGRLISDYRWIGTGGGPESWNWERGRKLDPADTLAFHKRDHAWLEAKLESPFDGETVVITHMCPSRKSVPERFKTSGLSAAFSSNLDELILRTRPALWVHGHTHDSFDYRIGKTRVVCNPWGYYGRELNPEFREDLVVEI